MDKGSQQGVLTKAIDRTPPLVLAICGTALSMTICFVAALQLSGMSPPLQRIVNAKALEIEIAANRTTKAANSAEQASLSLTNQLVLLESGLYEANARLSKVENRLYRLEKKQWTN